MTRYNPYFLQLVDTPGFKGNFDLILAVLGYTTLIVTRVTEPPGVCRDQLEFVESVEASLERGLWTRRSVEYVVLFFLLAWGGRYKFSGGKLVGLSCTDAYKYLSVRMRIYPQVCNDLRRGYILSITSDPMACREWVEARNQVQSESVATPTSLAHAVAEGFSGIGASDFRVTGAAILLLGTLSRITPAYHLLAIALGYAARYAEGGKLRVCSDTVLNSLPDVLKAAKWIDAVAGEIQTKKSDPRSRAAELLTAEVRLLCHASRVLREAMGLDEAVEALRRASKLFGISSELLDPTLYLEDVGVLGVDPRFAQEEVEACLSRCE